MQRQHLKKEVPCTYGRVHRTQRKVGNNHVIQKRQQVVSGSRENDVSHTCSHLPLHSRQRWCLILAHHPSTARRDDLVEHIRWWMGFGQQKALKLSEWAHVELLPVLTPAARGTVPEIFLILVDLACVIPLKRLLLQPSIVCLARLKIRWLKNPSACCARAQKLLGAP